MTVRFLKGCFLPTLLLVALFVLTAGSVFAQQSGLSLQDVLSQVATQSDGGPAAVVREDDFVPLTADEKTEPFVSSFLFTPQEIGSLKRARSGKVSINVKKPSEDEGKPGVVIPAKRVISVSGVLLRKPGDWIVWINGQKMIPSVLLPEIVDIKVEKDKVHLKWYDVGLNKVIEISMRPHQTYDIVSGVLTPG